MKRLSLISLTVGMLALAASARAAPTPKLAPLKKVSGLPSKFGLLEAPIDMSHLVPPITIMAPPPPSWDWRTHSGVTPVKDQNPYGACWAFAATGSIESRVLLDESATNDFAEMELIHCNASGLTCNSGGNAYYATFYDSLHGTAQESCNPYVSCDTATCHNCALQKQVSAWEQICTSPNTAAIKDAVYNIGPVYTTMYASDPSFQSYNSSSPVIYNPSSPATDHAVLIVGYDDNMVHAGGKGAWIVKNSWGTGWGYQGYFYIAYGSWSIGTNSSVYSGYRNYPPNQKVLTYENDVPWSSVGYDKPYTTAWGAVLFTPTLTGNLTHVGFWARATGTSYTIKIFDNWNDGAPTVQLNTTQSGTFTRAGYYTIPLTTPVAVVNGDEIVIMIEITTPGYYYPIPLDTASPYETYKSYISDTGANGTWEAVDIGGANYGDFAFRAYIVPTACTYQQKIGAELRVTNNSSGSYGASLSWTGSEFGVSWEDDRDGNYEIYFARVSLAGAKIGSDLRVTNDAGYSQFSSLSWTGSEFGVSWQDSRDGNWEIYFARISSAGAKIGSDLRVTSAAGSSIYPSLTWTGSEFGVSWDDYRDGSDGSGYQEIYFARVSAAGAKLGSDLRVTNDASYSVFPTLSWTGSEFGVSWDDYRDGNEEIYFARVSSAGAKIGSDLRVTSAAGSSIYSSLTWTGSEFGVIWYDGRNAYWEIYFARVSSSGAKLGSDLRVTSNAYYFTDHSLSWAGSEFGVSWSDNRDGNFEIYFARLSSTGTKLGSDLRVTNAANDRGYTSLSWTGSEFGVSWWDNRDGNAEIYFARIGCPNLDTDGDGMPDFWESQYGCMQVNVLDNLLDYDSDGLNNDAEYAAGTNPCLADTDGDGLNDKAELDQGLDPLNPDTDGDLMPDGWEVSHSHGACIINPLGNDAMSDPDGDGLENINEYYNNWDDNTSDPCDDSKPKIGRPGMGFFGDADGSLSIGGPDLDQVALILSGNAPSYSRVYPEVQMIQDFDGSGDIGGPDLDYLQLMLSGNVVSPLGWPTTLSQVLPVVVPSIQVGHTVAIKVKLTTIGGLERPGFGVVFSVSQGSAMLYGGEGWGSEPGSRYDLTDANGEARIVVKVNAAGTILVHVEMPAADPAHDLMSGAAVALPSEAEIMGIP